MGMSLDKPQGTLCRLVPLDERQRRLSHDRIKPILPRLAQEFDLLRRAIDQTVHHVFAEGQEPARNPLERHIEWGYCDALLVQLALKHFANDPPNITRYPLGYCSQITLIGHEYVRREGAKGSSAFRQLLRFEEEGGIFKIIWGSIKGCYFQTALQIGAYYVDIANDTVDPTKTRVDWAPLETSGFKNFDTLGEFAEVKASYHAVDLYWNDFIPALFPYCPLIEISQARRCVSVVIIKDPIRMAINGPLESVFGDFGTGSAVKYASDALVNSLAVSLTGNEPSLKRLTLSRMDHDEMAGLLRLQVAATPEERANAAQKCQTIARFFNLAWLKSTAFDKIDTLSNQSPAA